MLHKIDFTENETIRIAAQQPGIPHDDSAEAKALADLLNVYLKNDYELLDDSDLIILCTLAINAGKVIGVHNERARRRGKAIC